MVNFTITLPKHDFTIPFNHDIFIQLFPNSLITLTLQSRENTIELENELVTPDILETLSYVITNKDYPYIGNPNGKKILDYLGIDFPNLVYESAYAEFKRNNPDIRLLVREDLNTNYYDILNSAIKAKFPLLVTYLFSQTNPAEHDFADFQLFQNILNSRSCSSEQESIAEMILKNRRITPYLVSVAIDFAFRDAFRLGYKHLLQVLSQVFQRTPEIDLRLS